MSGAFAIVVTVTLKPGTAEAFLPHILKNAESSRRDEPDCLQFQVLKSEDQPDSFVFYEVYTDESALGRHRESPHFTAYIEAAGDMIADRIVQRLTLVDQ